MDSERRIPGSVPAPSWLQGPLASAIVASAASALLTLACVPGEDGVDTCPSKDCETTGDTDDFTETGMSAGPSTTGQDSAEATGEPDSDPTTVGPGGNDPEAQHVIVEPPDDGIDCNQVVELFGLVEPENSSAICNDYSGDPLKTEEYCTILADNGVIGNYNETYSNGLPEYRCGDLDVCLAANANFNPAAHGAFQQAFYESGEFASNALLNPNFPAAFEACSAQDKLAIVPDYNMLDEDFSQSITFEGPGMYAFCGYKVVGPSQVPFKGVEAVARVIDEGGNLDDSEAEETDEFGLGVNLVLGQPDVNYNEQSPFPGALDLDEVELGEANEAHFIELDNLNYDPKPLSLCLATYIQDVPAGKVIGMIPRKKSSYGWGNFSNLYSVSLQGVEDLD